MAMIKIPAKDFYLVCPKCGWVEDLYTILRLRFDFGCARCETSFKEFDALVDPDKLDSADWWK